MSRSGRVWKFVSCQSGDCRLGFMRLNGTQYEALTRLLLCIWITVLRVITCCVLTPRSPLRHPSSGKQFEAQQRFSANKQRTSYSPGYASVTDAFTERSRQYRQIKRLAS